WGCGVQAAGILPWAKLGKLSKLSRLLRFGDNVDEAADAAKLITRSIDDAATLRGATAAEIDALVPSSWVKSPTKGAGGVRYSHPERLGEQIRVMPGNPVDPNPLKQGPYVRISRNGSVTDPIPLDGNSQLG